MREKLSILKLSAVDIMHFDFSKTRGLSAMDNANSQHSGPAYPMFVQMNARLVEVDDQWREVSRWIKYQENVEDGGKRWSKPFVPSWQVLTILNSILEMEMITFSSAVLSRLTRNCKN